MKSISDRIEDQLRVTLEATPATFQEQINDIDFWYKGVSYSIKAHYRAATTGNYAFELSLLTHGGLTQRPGNFYKCRATRCIYWDGHAFYVFDTSELKALVDLHNGKITKTSRNTAMLNRAQGRMYEAAILKLLPTKVVNEIALVTFTLNNAVEVMQNV